MELNVRTMQPQDSIYRLYNKDTGTEIKFAFWANDETGDYKIYKNDGDHIIYNRKVDGDTVPELILHGNIEFRKVE